MKEEVSVFRFQGRSAQRMAHSLGAAARGGIQGSKGGRRNGGTGEECIVDYAGKAGKAWKERYLEDYAERKNPKDPQITQIYAD